MPVLVARGYAPYGAGILKHGGLDFFVLTESYAPYGASILKRGPCGYQVFPLKLRPIRGEYIETSFSREARLFSRGYAPYGASELKRLYCEEKFCIDKALRPIRGEYIEICSILGRESTKP